MSYAKSIVKTQRVGLWARWFGRGNSTRPRCHSTKLQCEAMECRLTPSATPVVQFTTTSQTVPESNTKDIVTTVQLSEPATTDLNILINMGGTAKLKQPMWFDNYDYAIKDMETPNAVHIARGQLSGTMTLNVENDTNSEPTETAVLTIDPKSQGVTVGTNKSFTLSITDDDTGYTKFVNHLYRDTLGRGAEGAGLADWAGRLNSGATRESVVDAFWTSVEHRALQVESFYKTYLNRPAEEAGRKYWIDASAKGWSEQDIQRGFTTSPEYLKLHPTDKDYIPSLYQNILGRTASATELATWGAIGSKQLTADAVAKVFLACDEYHVDIIKSTYQQNLGRVPDANEQSKWLKEMNESGLSQKTFTDDLLSNDEYFAKP